MSSGCETKLFTVTWKVENFSTFSSEIKKGIRSPVWKTETTEDYARWRFLLNPTNLDLEFALTSFKKELKEDYKYEMSLLSSSGEIKLIRNPCDNNGYCCSYKIEKNKIFGETSDSFLLQGTLTLCCRIWLQKLKPGRCFLRTALHEVNFSWVIEGFSLDPDSIKRSLHEEEKFLIFTILHKCTTIEKRNYQVRIELLPDYGKWSTFRSCHIDIGDGIRRVISSNFVYPAVGWLWNLAIDPEECPDGRLHLKFKCLIAVDEEHPKSPDAAVGSSSTLSRDLLQLYRKKTFSDVTLKTEGDTSISTHKNILATRSRVFEAMFEKSQTVEGRSGVVAIDDVDSETLDRLLVYLYSDFLEKELRWEEASALYYAADKYAVLPLKRECAQVIMVTMAADNVCDVLVLADRHTDELLMSRAVDFVRYNQEVMSTPAWENLEKSNALLANKVYRQVFLQKDKK